jgi:hypothetical protein
MSTPSRRSESSTSLSLQRPRPFGHVRTSPKPRSQARSRPGRCTRSTRRRRSPWSTSTSIRLGTSIAGRSAVSGNNPAPHSLPGSVSSSNRAKIVRGLTVGGDYLDPYDALTPNLKEQAEDSALDWCGGVWPVRLASPHRCGKLNERLLAGLSSGHSPTVTVLFSWRLL